MVFALDVGSSGETDKVDQPGFTDVRGDVFGGDLWILREEPKARV